MSSLSEKDHAFLSHIPTKLFSLDFIFRCTQLHYKVDILQYTSKMVCLQSGTYPFNYMIQIMTVSHNKSTIAFECKVLRQVKVTSFTNNNYDTLKNKPAQYSDASDHLAIPYS